MYTTAGTLELIKQFTGADIHPHKDMLEIITAEGSLTSYQQKLLLKSRVKRIEYQSGSYWIWLN